MYKMSGTMKEKKEGMGMNNLIVAYKFGSRFNGNLSPKEGINIYELHAQANNGKVLFTVNKVPRPEYRDKIKEIILMTKDGSFAIHANVDSLGKYSSLQPPGDYIVPSIWNDEKKEELGWFALSGLKRISIHAGDYTSVNGKDLLESMRGNAYMTYVSI